MAVRASAAGNGSGGKRITQNEFTDKAWQVRDADSQPPPCCSVGSEEMQASRAPLLASDAL